MKKSRDINIAEMSEDEFANFLRSEVGNDMTLLCQLGEQLFDVWQKSAMMSQVLITHAESLHPDFLIQLQKYIYHPSSTIQ